MFGICLYVFRCKIRNTQWLQTIMSYRKLYCTFLFFFTFSQTVDIYGFHISSQYVQKTIGSCQIINHSLLMTFIFDSSQFLMSNKIYNIYSILLSLQIEDIEIVPSFLIGDIGRCKRIDSTLMLMLFDNSAIDELSFPLMDTFSHMSIIFGILKEVNEEFSSILLEHVCMEECDILGLHSSIFHLYNGFIQFVHPMLRNLLRL